MKAFEEHLVLRADHVVVVVVREVHLQAVGGLGAIALADVVGEDEEVPGDVERLAGTEEDVGEDGVQQRVALATGAVQQKDGVIHVAGGIAMRSTEREVVESELGKRFASAEAEVMRDVELVFDRPLRLRALLRGCGGHRLRGGDGGECGEGGKRER